MLYRKIYFLFPFLSPVPLYLKDRYVNYLLVLFACFCVLRQGFIVLCSPGCPRSHFIDQAGLECRDHYLSLPPECTTTAPLVSTVLNKNVLWFKEWQLLYRKIGKLVLVRMQRKGNPFTLLAGIYYVFCHYGGSSKN